MKGTSESAMTELEKRMHRCCFAGHRPEKIDHTEQEIKHWLSRRIDLAIMDGFVTFITGCCMGVDIWAAEVVIEKRKENPALHLIAAVPWPGFPRQWSEEWRARYEQLLKDADLVVNVSKYYRKDVFELRNRWMVDHSNRVIAFYNEKAGGSRYLINYADGQWVDVVRNE